jgi:hypothetical protein
MLKMHSMAARMHADLAVGLLKGEKTTAAHLVPGCLRDAAAKLVDWLILLLNTAAEHRYPHQSVIRSVALQGSP